MTKLTQSALIQHAGNIPPALVRAVIRQFGGWQAFAESAPDVVAHGISGGFGGFIYYSETESFARKHGADILMLCESMRGDLGEPGTLAAIVAGFGCLPPEYTAARVEAVLIGRSQDADDATQIYHELAWFAAEEVCRAYTDATERAED